MPPRIVSWSDNEICISPFLSSAASVVSFDSTFSDTYPSHWQMSPTASEAPGLHSADLGGKHTSLPGFTEGRKTPKDGHATPGDSFIRHGEYFFKDGNVTFLVGGTLYCVHRYFFSRDSVYFSTRFTQLGIRDHEAVPTIISIGDIERNDFEALLSVLYPANFEAHELLYEQWKSVLHLSTRWGFASLRKLAFKSIKPPTPLDRLVLARTYSIDHWVLPALIELCERTVPLSVDEARQMSMEDVILVATVREEIRGGALRVDVADIPRHIEVVLAGKSNRPAGNDVHQDGPMNRATGKKQDLTMPSAVGPNVEAQIAKATGTASPSSPQHRDANEGDTRESVVKRPWKEVPVGSPGVVHPHVVVSTAQDCLKEGVATSAVQTRGTRKLEEAPGEAAAWPNSQTEKAGSRAKQAGEQIATQRAMDNAARAAAATSASSPMSPAQGSGGSSWFSMTAPELEAEKERLESKAKSKAEAAKAEQIARQRAADRAARAAAAASDSSPMSPAWGSGGGGWFSKIASGVASATIPTEEPLLPPKSANLWNSDPWSKRQGKNTASPNTEFGPLRGAGGPGAPVQHSPTASSTPRGSASTHPATSITVAHPSANAVVSSPTPVSQSGSEHGRA